MMNFNKTIFGFKNILFINTLNCSKIIKLMFMIEFTIFAGIK